MKKLILLPLALILFVAPLADDILTEDFESSSMPTDWQVWEENTPYAKTWYFDYLAGSGNGYNSDGSAVQMFDEYNDVDNWLVTPTLDMSGYENLSFSLWYCGDSAPDYSGTFLMGSDVASPAAGDFTQIYELGPPENYPNWIEHPVDVSAYDSQSTVTFAVRYTGQDGHVVYMDDVLITGDVGTGIEAASLGAIKAIYK